MNIRPCTPLKLTRCCPVSLRSSLLGIFYRIAIGTAVLGKSARSALRLFGTELVYLGWAIACNYSSR
jgi:hypothetical protein